MLDDGRICVGLEDSDRSSLSVSWWRIKPTKGNETQTVLSSSYACSTVL